MIAIYEGQTQCMLRVKFKMQISRDVVLGTCTCTRVVLEYHFKVLVLVLEGSVLVDM